MSNTFETVITYQPDGYYSLLIAHYSIKLNHLVTFDYLTVEEIDNTVGI